MTAVAAVIGVGWLVEISLRDVLDGVTGLLRLMRFDVDRHVPIGLVVAVVLAVFGLVIAWPSAYRKLRRWSRVMTVLKWVKAWSGWLLVPIFLLPLWVALIVPLLAAYSHWCHARSFLRATAVRHHHMD